MPLSPPSLSPPRSNKNKATSPAPYDPADTDKFIDLRDAVQRRGANDLVLFDGKAASAASASPRSPLSPTAWWQRRQASEARARIADRFNRALPVALSREQAATPFNHLTDAGPVRVYQLRLLVAMVKFQRDLVAGGMRESEACALSMQAFNPETWRCRDPHALYDQINSCLIRSNERVVRACLAAAKRHEPPASEEQWRHELETAAGVVNTRRRSLSAQAAVEPAAPPLPTQQVPPRPPVNPEADAVPEASPARRPSRDDHKSTRSASGPRPQVAAYRSATGEGAGPTVSRSLAADFAGAGSPHPDAPRVAPLDAPSPRVATGAASLADRLTQIPMYGAPTALPPMRDQEPVARGRYLPESDRARLADTQGHRLGLSSPERPTGLADLREWGARLAGEVPYPVVADASSEEAQAQAQSRARWHRDFLPALQGLHERLTRASGQPLSNRFRDELLRWPLSVRASLLRCSANGLQGMDPRGPGWVDRYRFHAELARSLVAEDCYTDPERQLQARVIDRIQAQAGSRQQGGPNFRSVVVAVRAIFTQAAQGEGPGPRMPSFALGVDTLTRQRATYNPFTRAVLIGPEALHERNPMPYVLRHVAAASMHFYNHRLIDALHGADRLEDGKEGQIGSMLHALEQVPITAAGLERAGLSAEQAKLLVLQTLPKQRSLAFARAVSEAWASARRASLADAGSAAPAAAPTVVTAVAAGGGGGSDSGVGLGRDDSNS